MKRVAAQGSRLKAQGGTVPIQPRAFSLEPRAHRGFSLVELIISMAILSVGLVGAMRVFPVGLRASQRAELSSRATLVAQRTIESLKLLPWTGLPEGSSTATVEEFTVMTKVSQPPASGLVDPARLKAVSVTVGWTQDGRPRDLLVTTYLRQPTS